jgi:hypothetical protein
MPSTLNDYRELICGNSKCSDKELKNKFLSNPLIQEKVMYEYTVSHLELINKEYPNLIKKETDLVFYLAEAHFTGV